MKFLRGEISCHFRIKVGLEGQRVKGNGDFGIMSFERDLRRRSTAVGRTVSFQEAKLLISGILSFGFGFRLKVAFLVGGRGGKFEKFPYTYEIQLGIE